MFEQLVKEKLVTLASRVVVQSRLECDVLRQCWDWNHHQSPSAVKAQKASSEFTQSTQPHL